MKKKKLNKLFKIIKKIILNNTHTYGKKNMVTFIYIKKCYIWKINQNEI